ncbi:MAG: glycosyltransferase family 2 protein [Candidatus Chisholmbacteria bacterium]|nr:glycosyltransferase family 2 protein [Candidatus Chisholmbacteria bacterium]
MKLSVVLATHNEAANITNCLKSVKSIADEVIVVDGESTDNTVALARKIGAKVYEVKNQPMFHINKQIALQKAGSTWILQLDADEMLDATLRQSIRGVLKSNPPENGFYLKRKNFFLGRLLKKGGQYPDPVIRLVRRGKAYFPQKSVHDSNRYTSLTAQKLKADRVSLSFLNWINYVVIKPTATFLKLYLRHQGWLDGFPGFVFALFSGLHWPVAFMKYWELVNVKPVIRK